MTSSAEIPSHSVIAEMPILPSTAELVGFNIRRKEQDEELKNENEILDEIKGQPALARPDWSRRFYLKTDRIHAPTQI